MSSYDLDSLRLLAREHHENRLREGTAERLARELGGRPQRRLRVRLTIGSLLNKRQRADRPRFEG
jgi:hypothetical protein